MAFKNKITNTIPDAAPANKWAHFRKKACCGKGGKTTNSSVCTINYNAKESK